MESLRTQQLAACCVSVSLATFYRRLTRDGLHKRRPLTSPFEANLSHGTTRDNHVNVVSEHQAEGDVQIHESLPVSQRRVRAAETQTHRKHYQQAKR